MLEAKKLTNSNNDPCNSKPYNPGNTQDPNKPLISVIMPVYKLSKLVTHSIRAVEKVLDANGYSYEIVVVDDGSPDDTYKQALTASSNPAVRVYRLPRNMGKGFALLYGFKKSRGDIIVFFDGAVSSPIQMAAKPGRIPEAFSPPLQFLCQKPGRQGNRDHQRRLPIADRADEDQQRPEKPKRPGPCEDPAGDYPVEGQRPRSQAGTSGLACAVLNRLAPDIEFP